ncbi:MAG: glycosyltransferase [candidate division WOR-3 bacterium]
MKVVLVSGGTGGHISPALSVSAELDRRKISKVLLLGGLKVDFPIKESFLEFSAGEIKLRNLNAILKGIFQTFDPVVEGDVLLGFGGYPQLPPMINAIINNKPYYLFEGDAVAGKSNKVLSVFSRGVFCAFRSAVKYFSKGIFVGIPVRKLEVYEREHAHKVLGIDTKLPVVGIIGGSQGSKILNEIAKNLADLNKFFILGIVGKRGEDAEGKNYKFVKFLKDISPFYSAADVIISRAGVSSIGEICYFKKPALFIPYSYAGGHQVFNAMDVYNFGAAEMLLERDTNIAKVVEILEKLLKNSERYISKLSQYFEPYAEKRIVDTLIGQHG